MQSNCCTTTTRTKLYKQNISQHTHKNLAGSIDGYDTDAFVEGNKFETEMLVDCITKMSHH